MHEYHYELRIPGLRAVPKQSTRFTRGGGAYTPKRVRDFASTLKQAWREKYGNQMAYGPITIAHDVYYRRPKGRKDDEWHNLHVSVPDRDNLSKSIQDALNGVAYPDDRWICKDPAVPGGKYYGDDYGIVIRIDSIMPMTDEQLAEVMTAVKLSKLEK